MVKCPFLIPSVRGNQCFAMGTSGRGCFGNDCLLQRILILLGEIATISKTMKIPDVGNIDIKPVLDKLAELPTTDLTPLMEQIEKIPKSEIPDFSVLIEKLSGVIDKPSLDLESLKKAIKDIKIPTPELKEIKIPEIDNSPILKKLEEIMKLISQQNELDELEDTMQKMLDKIDQTPILTQLTKLIEKMNSSIENQEKRLSNLEKK